MLNYGDAALKASFLRQRLHRIACLPWASSLTKGADGRDDAGQDGRESVATVAKVPAGPTRRANRSVEDLFDLQQTVVRRPSLTIKFASAEKLILQAGSNRSPSSGLLQKFSSFFLSENMYTLRRPASIRGAYRDRHETRGGMRWACDVAA
jgi:hypothetical protein